MSQALTFLPETIRLGALLAKLALPWLILADWNAEPIQFIQSGWASRLGGEIMAPDVAMTCTSGEGRLIDFGLFSFSARSIVRRCGVTKDTFKPHLGVWFALNKNPAAAQIRVMKKPPVIKLPPCKKGQGLEDNGERRKAHEKNAKKTTRTTRKRIKGKQAQPHVAGNAGDETEPQDQDKELATRISWIEACAKARFLNETKPGKANSEVRGSAAYSLTAVDAEQFGKSYSSWIIALEVLYIHNVDGEDIHDKCHMPNGGNEGRGQRAKVHHENGGRAFQRQAPLSPFHCRWCRKMLGGVCAHPSRCRCLPGEV